MTTSTDPRSEPTGVSEHHAAIDITVGSEQQAYSLGRGIAHKRTETLLDEALAETFPASDAVAITPR